MELFLLFLTLPFLGTSVPLSPGLRGLLPPAHLSWKARAAIVGGEEAPEDEWPWQVSLRMQEDESNGKYWKYLCGGSLIHTQWILTAASCFSNFKQKPSSLRIQLREQHLYYEDKLLPVSKIVVHSNFTFENEGSDIALIQLKDPAKLSSHVQPVHLPDASQSFDGKECWVTGWGYLGGGESLPPPFSLRQVQVSVMDNQSCDQLYHKVSTIDESVRIVPEDMICAGKEDTGACEGDQGAPLVCKVEDSWLQVGVASWIEDCQRDPIRPGVYTSIPQYVDWIQKIIQ
ncbi:tryptase-like isoform X1 [Monodelphis domestica]|nr:tryptase-like isoform X1 [Monodelphis domestica]